MTIFGLGSLGSIDAIFKLSQTDERNPIGVEKLLPKEGALVADCHARTDPVFQQLNHILICIELGGELDFRWVRDYSGRVFFHLVSLVCARKKKYNWINIVRAYANILVNIFSEAR